jgi:hypothetical protein
MAGMVGMVGMFDVLDDPAIVIHMIHMIFIHQLKVVCQWSPRFPDRFLGLHHNCHEARSACGFCALVWSDGNCRRDPGSNMGLWVSHGIPNSKDDMMFRIQIAIWRHTMACHIFRHIMTHPKYPNGHENVALDIEFVSWRLLNRVDFLKLNTWSKFSMAPMLLNSYSFNMFQSLWIAKKIPLELMQLVISWLKDHLVSSSFFPVNHPLTSGFVLSKNRVSHIWWYNHPTYIMDKPW